MAAESEKSGKPWRWKPGDESAPQPGLLYEPGNWGDVLKGAWACLVADAVAEWSGKHVIWVLDPFAGAPKYPLTKAARERFESLPESRFKDAQRVFVEQECWASTSMAILSARLQVQGAAYLEIFDADEGRREVWSKSNYARVLHDSGGEAILESYASKESHTNFVLIDPYDLFDRWGVFLDAAQKLAQRCPVLLYLYNKSPRGTGYADQYGRFRIALANRFRDCGVKIRLGRLPSDLKEPRAYHEVILAAPSNQPYSAFEDALRAATEDLAKLFPVPFTCFEDGLRPEGA